MHQSFSPHLTDDQQEAYEERSAIMEYDGELPRKEAERLAWQIVNRELLERWGL